MLLALVMLVSLASYSNSVRNQFAFDDNLIIKNNPAIRGVEKIPALLGVAVLVSARLGYPVIRLLLYNPKLLDTERISTILRTRGQDMEFESRLLNATYLLGATFFFSAVMNYLLARWIVVSPAGSAAFNEELGQLTLISYPVIAVPSMLMILGIFYILWRNIHGLTGLTLEEIMAPSLADKQRE